MDRLNKVSNKRFVLASQSPRRQAMFDSLNLNHIIRPMDVDESFEDSLKAEEIPLYLAKKKAEPQVSLLEANDILVTADTVVWINGHVLNKPADLSEAKRMLSEISNATHHVYTAVCLTTTEKQHLFYDGTEVHFHPLSEHEIDHYLSKYHPLDKAGAYGIQEFIGYIGIKKVVGDFYNVVGFPVQRFWRELNHIL